MGGRERAPGLGKKFPALAGMGRRKEAKRVKWKG